MKPPDWANKAIDILLLHEKHILHEGQTKSGRPFEKKVGWSIRDTAKELNISVGSCHNYILVGKALRRNKNLMLSSSFRRALSLVKRSL